MPKHGPEPPSSEITPLEVYTRRRAFLKQAAAFTATAAGFGGGLIALVGGGRAPKPPAPPATPPLPVASASAAPEFQLPDEKTPFEDVTTTTTSTSSAPQGRTPPSTPRRSSTRPWTVAVEGEVNKPQRIDLDDLIKLVPARGARLSHALRRGVVDGDPVARLPAGRSDQALEPTRSAKYVAFTTLLDPDADAGPEQRACSTGPTSRGCASTRRCTRSRSSPSGLYGKTLPNQNGAPLRLVVPWKYGFKGIKSIVKIRFVDEQPTTTWNSAAPGEYGFYANVNPSVDHPRWSQATERRIGELVRRKTLPFNGYADQVASLYAGMDSARTTDEGPEAARLARSRPRHRRRLPRRLGPRPA